MVSIIKSKQAGGERGATDVFLLMLMTTLVLFAGLAFDVGMLFNAHREATNVAAAAARSGADELSTDALYNGRAEIDEARARQAVNGRLPADFTEVKTDVGTSDIFVQVRTTHEPHILSAFGFGTFTIDGEATAQVTNGAPASP